MYLTYQAVLKGNRIEWTEATPLLPGSGEGVPVYVTILTRSTESPASRGEQMVAILEQIAALGGIKSIPDPMAWQQEIRQDRPLAGREES